MRWILSAGVVLSAVVLLSSCSVLSGITTPGDDNTNQMANVQMQHIADAVKHRDAAALTKLFSPVAREKATDLNGGITSFLSSFPTGLTKWKLEDGNTGGEGDDDFPSSVWLTYAFYEVSANGKKYDLYFAEMTSDTNHPDRLGIYALGIAPYNPEPYTAPSASSTAFLAWVKQFKLSDNDGITGTPGVYVPKS